MNTRTKNELNTRNTLDASLNARPTAILLPRAIQQNYYDTSNTRAVQVDEINAILTRYMNDIFVKCSWVNTRWQ